MPGGKREMYTMPGEAGPFFFFPSSVFSLRLSFEGAFDPCEMEDTGSSSCPTMGGRAGRDELATALSLPSSPCTSTCFRFLFPSMLAMPTLMMSSIDAKPKADLRHQLFSDICPTFSGGGRRISRSIPRV